MFKRKKSSKTNSSLDPKIRLEKSTKDIPKRKKRKRPLISKKKGKVTKRKKRTDIKKLLNFLLLTLIVITIGYLLFRSVSWIIKLRSSNTEQNELLSYVVGFNDLPTYPASEYIFPDDTINTVSQFLTTGRSIYRLARNNTIEDVFSYYQEVLEDSKWDHIQSVPRTSHEMMYGEYYFNEEIGYGVRIYDRVNDVWYEKVTKNEANTGKASQVSKKYERDLILSSDEGTSLLPDFPWALTIPKEYLVKYFPTNEGDLRGVTFTEISSGKETVLEPIAQLNGSPDDIYSEIYVSKLEERNDEEDDNPQDESRQWELVNSQYVDINGVYLLESTLNHRTELSKIYIIHNEKVNYAYAIHIIDGDTTFLNFMLLNITEQKSDYTGDEFKFDD